MELFSLGFLACLTSGFSVLVVLKCVNWFEKI